MTKIRNWAPLALIALACLVVEGAFVIGVAFLLGNWLYDEFGQSVAAIPPCIVGLDRC